MGHVVRHPGNRGQALAELALVLPAVMLLLLGAVDLGRLFATRITAVNAARGAAMMAASDPASFEQGAPCSPTNKVVCAALREAGGAILSEDVSLTCVPYCSQTYGATVQVIVHARFSPVTPLIGTLLGGGEVEISASAMGRVLVMPSSAGVVPVIEPTPEPTSTPDAATAEPAAPTPTPEPTPSPSPTCPPPVVGFTTFQQNKNWPVDFTSTSGPTTGACAINYYRWNFGDGTTSAGALPSTSHVYADPKGRTFLVTLTVTTPAGTFDAVRSVTTQG